MILRLLLLVAVLMLSACGALNSPAPTTPNPSTSPGTGPSTPATKLPTLSQAKPHQRLQGGAGYYKDDGPLDVPFDLDSIPEPIPKAEPFHKFANNPYSVLGQSYTPLNRLGELKQKGFASWYGRKFHGQKTSIGEPYDMFQLTAAHPTLPIPSYARVTNTKTGKSVVVRINDRGPFHKGRIIDLSYNAAYRLGYLAEGSAEVEVESLVPDKQSSLEDPIEALAQTLSEPASAPEPQISPGNSPNEKLFVQLAAFSSAASAESFKSKVEYQFAWVKDVVAIQKDERTYRVRIGPYATPAEANLAANRLANSLESKPIVVR